MSGTNKSGRSRHGAGFLRLLSGFAGFGKNIEDVDDVDWRFAKEDQVWWSSGFRCESSVWFKKTFKKV